MVNVITIITNIIVDWWLLMNIVCAEESAAGSPAAGPRVCQHCMRSVPVSSRSPDRTRPVLGRTPVAHLTKWGNSLRWLLLLVLVPVAILDLTWVMLNHQQNASFGLSAFLKCGLDWICSFWYTVIFIFGHFGFKLPIHANYWRFCSHISAKWRRPLS